MEVPQVLRILWINHRDPKHPQAGGAETHLYEICTRLVQRGHEVTVLAERFRNSAKHEEVKQVRVRRRGGKWTLHLIAPYQLMRHAGKYDVVVDDIAHAVPFWSPFFTEKPVVAIVHHVHQGVVERELPAFLRQLVRSAEKSIKKTYENIVAVSEATKGDLINQLGVEESRIKVLYNGVDHALYRPGLKFEEPTILWIGRMKKYKNLDHIVRAFKIVKASVGNARLILAGNGEEQGRIRLLAAQEKLDSRIVFAGSVSADSKVRLLQGAWTIIYASEVEGWGIGIIEAAACGTPAVAYDAGALREAIIDGTTGYLTKYGAVDELAEKLIELLTNENLRRKLGENALMRSYDFDWDRTAAETEKFLRTLL